MLNREPEAIGHSASPPKPLMSMVRKALEKDPAFRHQSARELYMDLAVDRRRCASSRSAERRPGAGRRRSDTGRRVARGDAQPRD